MRSETTRSLRLMIIGAAAIALFGALACTSSKTPTANKAAEAPQPAPQTAAAPSPFDVKESKVIERTSPFSHTRAEHQTKTKDCAFCHQRLDNSVTPVFPGHSACIECHSKDFTNTSSQMCVVCHKSPVDAQGTRISFPAKMSEFGVKGFSHKQHMDSKKMAGETDPPSINDMITTGQAGSLLGEALYRMADRLLRQTGELLAALVDSNSCRSLFAVTPKDFSDPSFDSPGGFYWAARRHHWLPVPQGVRLVQEQ